MKIAMRYFFLLLLEIMIGLPTFAQDLGKENGVEENSTLRFKMVSIDEKFPYGYQINVADMNSDGAYDIIALREGDDGLVAWYENPSWIPHRITPTTISRPISMVLKDIDGDGDLDLTLAHDFDFFDSVEKGSVSWLEHGKDSTTTWTPHLIDREPMQHRVLWADLDGNGNDELISIPLLGVNAKPTDVLFSPVRIKVSQIPSNPRTSPWPTTVLYDRFHAVHGMMKLPPNGEKRDSLFIASYEGISILRLNEKGSVECSVWHEGHQKNEANKGSSEITLGSIQGEPFYAAIEPRHGNELVLYPGANVSIGSDKPMRNVIDDSIQVGHGIHCADLNNDGISEILVGDRGEKKSYYLYYTTDRNATSWKKMYLDQGGLAGADCAIMDMDGDSDLDIVAIGSSTGNIRLYVNQFNPSSPK